MLCGRGAFFAEFVLTRRDNGDKRDEIRRASQEPSFAAPFSVGRRQPFSRFYQGCLLRIRKIKAQKRTRVFFNARVRFLL